MIKNLLTAAALVLSAAFPALAQPTVDLGAVSASPGTTASVPLSLSGSGGTVAAISTDISYDSASLTPQAPVADPRLSTIGKGAYWSIVSPGVVRIGIFGVSVDAIPDGSLATISFAVSASAAGRLSLRSTPDASDPDGNSLSIGGASGEINVVRQEPPVASFRPTPSSASAPVAASFTDTSTNAPTSWNWSFGDGGTSTKEKPVHVYTLPGVYTVSLTVANGYGSAGTTGTFAAGSCANTPVRIAKTTPLSFSDIATAYAGVHDTEKILVQTREVTGDFLFDRDLHTALRGGYDCDYTGSISTTSMTGKLRVKNGTVNLDALALR